MVFQGSKPIADPTQTVPGVAASRFQAPPPAVKSTAEGDVMRVKLPHAPGAQGNVALFLPKDFDPSRPAVIMPYFHGHGGSIDDALTRQKLTEQAAKSGKNIAFVIPQMGTFSDIKPAFTREPYASQFLDEAADALAKMYVQTHPGADAEKTAQAFKDMPVVPISYSGGYQAVLPTIKDPRVKGLVMLDSMYGSPNDFAAFTRRADKPFVSVTVGPSTQPVTDKFKPAADLQNVSFTPIEAKAHTPLVQNALEGILWKMSIGPDGPKMGPAEKPVQSAPKTPKPR